MKKIAIASLWKMDWLGQNGSKKDVALESRRKVFWGSRGKEVMRSSWVLSVQMRFGSALHLENEGKGGLKDDA